MWSRKSRKQSIELSEDAERGAEQVKRLLSDAFSHLVVDAAMRVLRDVDNPIRLNLFAAAVRELVTHVFHDLAPDAEVKACSWYVQDKNTQWPNAAPAGHLHRTRRPPRRSGRDRRRPHQCHRAR